MSNSTIFLKLGGSLITDKDVPYKVNQSTLDRIACEINQFIIENPKTGLLLGHGSGSFGHTSASQYNTRLGVHSHADWIGYQKVCHDARTLNHIVMETFQAVGLPVISYPPSGQVICENHNINKWDLTFIQHSLKKGLIPVIFGDAVIDTVIGGTILSTEDLFLYLAKFIPPKRILLAGIEDAVWADYPLRKEPIASITPHNFTSYKKKIIGSTSRDVTGGMAAKVENLLSIIKNDPIMKCQVFSGLSDGSVYSALNGYDSGTVICAD